MRRSSSVVLGTLSAFIMACSGGEKSADTASTSGSPSGGATPAAGTGTVHVVEMITDGTGNFFKPNRIEAKQGDIIRYTLTIGVHNANFLPDSNPGKQNLPKATDMLQLPGQTADVPVNFGPGTYYFQCDPHAMLGMVGHVIVTE